MKKYKKPVIVLLLIMILIFVIPQSTCAAKKEKLNITQVCKKRNPHTFLIKNILVGM